MKAPKDHVVITGTGRAGTSFLVRYLAELGMETHLSSHETPYWDASAQAGLEDELSHLTDDSQPLTQVIKSPWMYEYVDQLLEREDVSIECAIIPVRDLVATATSRTVVEMRARYQNDPQLTRFDETWETWCLTPGGTHYSLNPLDQARILAVGFHQLIERLTAADIKIIFLSFPQFVGDADYLYAKLKDHLPASADEAAARAAHDRVAALDMVRVEKELRIGGGQSSTILQPQIEFPDFDQLDRMALRRELERVHGEAANLTSLSESQAAQSQALAAERDALAAAYTDLTAERDGLLASRSWRITAPLRKLRRVRSTQG